MKFAKFTVLLVVACVLTGTGTTGVFASGEESLWDDPWNFHVNLYGWLPDAPATIEVNNNELADVPEGYDQVLLTPRII